jgi:hypothetical protein
MTIVIFTIPSKKGHFSLKRTLDRQHPDTYMSMITHRAGWQSGDAEDCKSFYTGSIPVPASNLRPYGLRLASQPKAVGAEVVRRSLGEGGLVQNSQNFPAVVIARSRRRRGNLVPLRFSIASDRLYNAQIASLRSQ